jgi:hypothetical protein
MSQPDGLRPCDVEVTELGMGHNQCCKNRRAPKTAKEFFALNYPSNPHGHDEVNNRLHNPEPVPVKFKKKIHKKIRKGWYFRIADEPYFLDGSGSGEPRGKVHGYEHKPASKRPDVNPVSPGDRVVCFNAANLKMLAPKDPGGPLELYGGLEVAIHQADDHAGEEAAPLWLGAGDSCRVATGSARLREPARPASRRPLPATRSRSSCRKYWIPIPQIATDRTDGSIDRRKMKQTHP